MARYDFRCRECETTFEVERPMAMASDPAPCPDGHTNTVKLMAAFASVGAIGGDTLKMSSASMPVRPSATGGGCCGGGCHTL